MEDTSQTKNLPRWVMILLIIFLQPIVWFLMFRDKRYHGWFPVLLWINSLVPLFFVFARLLITEDTLKIPSLGNEQPINPLIPYIVPGLFIAYTLLQIIFGFFLRKNLRQIGVLSIKSRLIAILFLAISYFPLGSVQVAIVTNIFNGRNHTSVPSVVDLEQVKPTPAPGGAQTINFDASPKLGPSPLEVQLGLFNQNPNSLTGFSTYSIDYGDGLHDSLKQYCGGAEGACDVRTSHTYTSSGTFTATLYGISAGGSSTTLGTVTIIVANRVNVTKTVGGQESSFLIQRINQNSVEGLSYQKYPVSGGEGTPKTLHIGDDIGYGCEGISEKLTKIDYSGQTVTFTETWSKKPGGCLICLAGKTLIDTPSGLVSVKDLQIGMPIWTTDRAGHRISGIVTKTSKVPVPPIHQMIHLVLDDERQLFVSPGHPTIDGRTVGDLVQDDRYDGASIVSAQRVPYDENATYDVLPSGETGFYWANGVLFGSTLRTK